MSVGDIQIILSRAKEGKDLSFVTFCIENFDFLSKSCYRKDTGVTAAIFALLNV